MSYQIQQYLAAAVESVLASGQSFVATANIQKNRDTTDSTVPRFEIEVNNISRASSQMAQAPSKVSVSGAGEAGANGIYAISGAGYVLGASYSIYSNAGYWVIAQESGGGFAFEKYISSTTGPNPWGLTYEPTGVPPGELPAPTVTESAVYFYNHFTADVDVSLITQRPDVDHAEAVARTRYLFSQEAQSFVSPVVTVFEVLSLEAGGETQEVNAEAREDWSKLSMRFEIGLLPGAYSVPTAG
jgi:hypothetical protein